MLNVDPAKLQEEPFPFLVQRMLFDPELYGELKATYPKFDAAAGWSRMSKDLVPGDAEFTHTVSSDAWKTLFDYVNSLEFLILMCGLFHKGMQSEDLLIDASALRLTEHVETRDWIAANNVGKAIADFRGPLEEVFVRMDFGIGETGYARPPHLDWRHRLCSMLVYFDDPVETKMDGGRFIVHGRDAEGYTTEAVVEPENNVGILKLDNNQSFHSVSEVTAIEGQRKTLFVAISSRGRIWRSDAA